MVKLNLEKIETIAFQLIEKVNLECVNEIESITSLLLAVNGICGLKGYDVDIFFPLCYQLEKCVQSNLEKIMRNKGKN